MNYIKRKSTKQEKRTALEFRGRTTPASGALSGAKGDVRTGTREGSQTNCEDFLIENKYTDKDFYTLKLTTWQKIDGEALRDNMRVPLMQVDIQQNQYVVLANNDYCRVKDESNINFVADFITERGSFKLSSRLLEAILGQQETCGLKFINKNKPIKLVIMHKSDFLSLRSDF